MLVTSTSLSLSSLLLVIVMVMCSNLDVTFGQVNPTYCKISPMHTLCKFPGVGPSCGQPVARGLSPAERALIVNLHNGLRAKVANGQETRGSNGPQPPAADMLEMVWDNELETIAQRWADQCQFGHDQIRNVDRFRVGQNVFQATTTVSGPVDWNQAVNGWYNEVTLFDKNIVNAYSFAPATGHYTQMVWGSTVAVGCGSVSYNGGGRFINKFVVCNYGPSGNFIGSPMYARGSACSRCPAGTSCSSKNPGLCSSGGRNSLTDPVRTPAIQDPVLVVEPIVPQQPILPVQPQEPNMSIAPSQPDLSVQPQQPPNQQPFFFFQQPQGVGQDSNSNNFLLVQQPQVPVQQPQIPVQQPQIPVQQPQIPLQQPQIPIRQPQRPSQQQFSFMRPVNGMFNRFFTFLG